MNDDYMQVSDIPGMDNLDNEETKLEKFELVEVSSSIAERDMDIESDYKTVRMTMNFQQQMLMESIKIALEQARNGEHPRQMEVVATLMAQLTSLNTKIISIHKDVTEISKPPESKIVNNIKAETVLIGTPQDVMDLVGSQQDQQEKVINND